MISSTLSCNFFLNLILVCKLYSVISPNLLIPHFNFNVCVEVDISSKKFHTRKYFQGKLCDSIHEVIYRLHLSRGILKVSFQHVSKIVNSMFQQVIASCACADSNVKYSGVKMFLLNLWSQCQNFIQKLQANLKI